MNQEVLRSFQKKIENELHELERSVKSIRSELRESSEVNSTALRDELDCAKGEADLNTRIEIYNHAVARQRELKAALACLNNGGFGKCVCCEDRIDIRRLHAHPCATLCMSCQESKELHRIPEPKRGSVIPFWMASELHESEKVA